MKRFAEILLLLLPGILSQAQTLVPNLPDIILDTTTNSVGYITGFEHDSATKKLYIAGQFQRVGNVNRQGFAVIDMTTGAVLNDLSFIALSDLTVNYANAKLKIYKNRLYIGGAFAYDSSGFYFGSYLFSINLSNQNVRHLYNLAPLSDFEIYNGKVYTSGIYENGSPEEFDVNEMDTLGNISWQRPINYTLNEHLSCLEVKNNILYVGGLFTVFGGVSVNNIAKVDLTTHTILNWQLSPQPGPSGNTTCYNVADIRAYSNDIVASITQGACATPPKNINGYNIATGNLNPQIKSIPYTGASSLFPEGDTMFWYSSSSGLNLYGFKNYTSIWSPTANNLILPSYRKAGYLFIGGRFSQLQAAPHKGLGVYCLAPEAPKRLSVFTKACQGQNIPLYIVTPVKYASSYSWSYTGTGVTITGTGSTVSLNFSSTATSGTFKVCAKSYCGTTGDTLFIPFTVYPPPNINAGSNIRFTCSHTIDSLNGSSSTPGATFSWSGPSYFSNIAVNQVFNTISSGNYFLYVTDPVSGCFSKDTVVVTHDTLAPVINHNLQVDLLTCKTQTLSLDAAPLYSVGDNLHWSGNAFSQNNPATITNPGNYTLTITSGSNDCISKDTFTVFQNIVLPTISAPAVLDTITCSRDSVLLPASSSTTNAILYWKNSQGDSLLNNSYTDSSGSYVAYALDTVNGCISALIRSVSQYTTPPVVNVPAGPLSINCSFSSATLNGNSPNVGASLNWSGPSGFSSGNPATVNQQGVYSLTVTNPQNGCIATDSVAVLLQNILILTSCNDTIICNGSTANLSAVPIGGTPGFSYSWSNGGNSQNITVAPGDTTNYSVTITDNAGCVGTDTVRVLVPAAISDSVKTFQPCDPNNVNGQVQAYGIGGIPPYLYALNGGAPQSSNIFGGLNFGNYAVTITDALGCSHAFSTTIDNSSILPAPDFILSTQQIKGDTFVLVDISNPRPDSIAWLLPANCTMINSNAFAPQIVHADTGALQVTMYAWFGTCQMQLTRNIVVMQPDTSFATDHNNNGIASLVLYPNPNSGQFTVDVTFHKKQSFAIFIFDALGNELQRVPYSQTDSASAAIQLNNPAPGTYLLKIIAEYDSRNRSFMISQ